jgi:hypothetical protein
VWAAPVSRPPSPTTVGDYTNGDWATARPMSDADIADLNVAYTATSGTSKDYAVARWVLDHGGADIRLTQFTLTIASRSTALAVGRSLKAHPRAAHRSVLFTGPSERRMAGWLSARLGLCSVAAC